MRKAVQYNIIRHHDHEITSSKVTAALLEGWQLYGSLQVSISGGGNTYYIQAMVKYEEVQSS